MTFRLFIIYNYLLCIPLFSYLNNHQLQENQITRFVDSIDNLLVAYNPLSVWRYKIFDSFGISILKFDSKQRTNPGYFENQLNNTFPILKVKASCLSDIKWQDRAFGIINISSGNIRKSPHHNSELVTQELMGTPVKVLKAEGDWYLIQTPNGYTGWIDAPAISLRTLTDMENISKQTYSIFVKHFGQIYSTTIKDEIVSDVVLGNILKVTQNLVGFYAVTLPDGRRGYIEKDGLVNLKSIFYQSKVDTVELVKLAKSFMGVSYLWGGKSSKAIDCSGFSSILYFFSGVVLQRDASQQIKYGEFLRTDNNFSNFKAGDLLFFGRKATNDSPEKVIHVGIYIGKGEFIHSSGFVRVSKINIQSTMYDNGNTHVFLRAIRIINSIGSPGIQRIEDNELYQYFCKE